MRRRLTLSAILLLIPCILLVVHLTSESGSPDVATRYFCC
jgi:hypothetical protein